ncbi:MAG: hypothetical protein AB1468_04220, partial [Candidatus Micrarchaeota archaeon]
MKDFSKLSREDVEEVASAGVFGRGKKYYKDGCVRSVVLVSPTKLEGRVQGTQLYKTKVTMEEGELVCSCSC